MAVIITTKAGMQNTTKGIFEAVSWVLEGASQDPTRHMLEGLFGEKEGGRIRLTASDGRQARTILVEAASIPDEMVRAIEKQAEKATSEKPQAGTKLFSIMGKPTKDTIILGDHELDAINWRKVFIDRSGLTGTGDRADVKGILEAPGSVKDKTEEALNVSMVAYAVFTATGKPYSVKYLSALKEGKHILMTHGITSAFHLVNSDCKAIAPALKEMTMIIAAMNEEHLVEVKPLDLSLEKSY